MHLHAMIISRGIINCSVVIAQYFQIIEDLIMVRTCNQKDKADCLIYFEPLYFRFEWNRTDSILGRSTAIVSWQTKDDEHTGMYRIRHSGYYKPIFQNPKSFTGVSRTFNLAAKTGARRTIQSYLSQNNRVNVFQPAE